MIINTLQTTKYKLFFTFIALLCLSCAGIGKPKPQILEKNVTTVIGNEFNSNVETVISEIEPIFKWLKWDIAFSNTESGLITLNETYVYKRKGKLHRISHFPTKRELLNSNVLSYVKKFANFNEGDSFYNSTAFTQETMIINISRIRNKKVKVDIKYTIRTYNSSYKKLQDLESNGKLEQIILEKLKDRLSNLGPQI